MLEICKYFKRRCPSDCVSASYYPLDNPQRSACVHRIYDTSKMAKVLKQMSVQLRAEVIESCFEATCRIQDQVYGCWNNINIAPTDSSSTKETSYSSCGNCIIKCYSCCSRYIKHE